MNKIIVASSNAHKIKEISDMLPQYEIISLKDIGFNEEIQENGTTFCDNAYIKAKTIYDKYHLPVISDDSGLCIDYLDGQPGIYSARFLGHDTPYSYKNSKIIEMLKDVSDDKRGCHYICAMVYIDINGNVKSVVGSLDGKIAKKIEGNNGFGYDPIFYVEQLGTTLAMVDESIKNSISHRHKALEMLKDEIK